MLTFQTGKTLEKFSSAYTLSDMEIFIFPELFYPLILANIISPLIWEWRKDPWFRDIFEMDMLKQSNALFGYEGNKYYSTLISGNILVLINLILI